MAAATVALPYGPRRAFIPYHTRQQRWAAIVAHRRCGKTVACVNDIIARALQLRTPHGRFAYVAPFLAQAKEVAWEYLKRFALPATADKNEAELWVELVNGARIRIHGADNPDRLRGAYLDGVVLDEYADMRPSVWGEVIRPMLADRQGWATFIGTPKGRNEFFEIFNRAVQSPDWFDCMLRASETGLLLKAELEDAKQDMTPEQYAQEFECSFDAAILGAYYAAEIAEAEREGRISSDVQLDPALPVHTAWDLGKGVNMAIWCWQVAPDGARIINYLAGAHKDGIPHMAAKLAALDYKRGHDCVPHDARATEIGTGLTRVETMLKLGLKPLVVPNQDVMDGINAVRVTFNKFWINKDACAEGIEALRQYRADYDEKLKVFKNAPLHDWSSHPADAFRYLAQAYRGFVVPQVKVKEPTELLLEADEFGQVRGNMSVRQIIEAKMRARRREDA